MNDISFSVVKIEQLIQFDRLIIGYSGGLDSTVLLHALTQEPSFQGKLVAVHVNHQLNKKANNWQTHCENICMQWGIPIVCRTIHIKNNSNIEEQARIARYTVFQELMDKKTVLLLAHQQNDQAETVLLQLFRGTGIAGLAAMPVSKPFGLGQLIRPLLAYSRPELEVYAKKNSLVWVDDNSNKDNRFSRNFIRQQIIPLLKTRWPAIVTNLTRTASHCQDSHNHLQALAYDDYPALKESSSVLSIIKIIDLSDTRLSNVLRAWLNNSQIGHLPNRGIHYRLIYELIRAPKRHGSINWGKIWVHRYGDCLYLVKNISFDKSLVLAWDNFPRSKKLPHGCLSATKTNKGLVVLPTDKIEIRFRQGGETFLWHKQTKSLKKLMQEWKIPPWLRDRTPLLFINDNLAMIVGYALSDAYYGFENSFRIELSN